MSERAQPIPVEELTVQQLREEVRYWRINATAEVAARAAAVRAGDLESRRQLAGAIETLSDALSGHYHDNCFACAKPIEPGMAVISDVNEGEMHAHCDEPWSIRPGDKVFMDPDSIVIDEDHPEGGEGSEKPDHIVAHEATPLYAHEDMLRHLEIARASLARAEEAAA